MEKKDWAPIAAAIASVITALLASLAGLGEHAPGVVAAMLIVAPVFFVYVQREKEITAERAARLAQCQECEKEQKEIADRAVSTIEIVSTRLATYERSLKIADQLAGLGVSRKEREGHEGARASGAN